MKTFTSASDDDLREARDKWDGARWDDHFVSLGVKAAGGARYDVGGNNDVLKRALLAAQKRRCWLQGSHGCQSRALLAREAQIDHVIPRTASPDILRSAIASSAFQQTVFDVHDPGNLAVICGPCNQEKSVWSPTDVEPALHMRRKKIEAARKSVIRGYGQWQSDAALDDAALKALAGAELSSDLIREMYADIAATMVENLAAQQGVRETLAGLQEVVVETEYFRFSVGPSDEAAESMVEMMADMLEADRRHGI